MVPLFDLLESADSRAAGVSGRPLRDPEQLSPVPPSDPHRQKDGISQCRGYDQVSERGFPISDLLSNPMHLCRLVYRGSLCPSLSIGLTGERALYVSLLDLAAEDSEQPLLRPPLLDSEGNCPGASRRAGKTDRRSV